jgi:hypothetical protein
MRLLSLAVVLALCAGSAVADDQKKPAEPVKDVKATKHEGKVTKIDGKKIMVKGTGADAKEMTFTTDDKTKFYRDAADKPEKIAKDDTKPADDKKGTPIKLSDIKEGDMVTVMAGADMVATEVWVHGAKKGTDK